MMAKLPKNFLSHFEKHIGALKDAGETFSSEEKLLYLLLILPHKCSHIIDVLDVQPEDKRTADYVKAKMMFDHCTIDGTLEGGGEGAVLKAQLFTQNSINVENPGAYKFHRCGLSDQFRKDCRVKVKRCRETVPNATPHTGPYKVSERHEKTFEADIDGKKKRLPIDWLKPVFILKENDNQTGASSP